MKAGASVGLPVSLGEGADGAAFRVPADNDFGDRQVGEPELDGCGLGAVRGARFLVGRNEVADVTDDEQIAGLGGGEQVRHHTAVGAGDKQRIGALAQRQQGKGVLDRGPYVLAKVDDAVEQFFHSALIRPSV